MLSGGLLSKSRKAKAKDKDAAKVKKIIKKSSAEGDKLNGDSSSSAEVVSPEFGGKRAKIDTTTKSSSPA